ncbi:PTS galactosamine transporter subunit IIB [Paratissierella segnis]|jgi:PTS system galactosamine-specific IIB component|uniref:PTS N-acetylgalactosamine transporter subunit IIB n=1 Tax=Paratissierella segnis TaxID=2763679 RepID=A0A926IK79_9FIRM|nr:PTS galactosamine transporter subunit IIB [Paratissierella segnis]MBC8587428.1 PTS N-acetylgalactosamine transporter subunit IIB [Paratissierella segnis]
MEGPNILLARIDNRLVHGQVGVVWLTSVGANLLVVVDDQAANEKLQQQLMSMVVESSGAGIRFFTVEHTIDIIHKASPSQKIFIICKTPAVIRQLVDGGVPIKDVNVGNMHFNKGKHQISKKVYVDEKDLEDLHYIKSKGINVFIQDVPGDAIEYID